MQTCISSATYSHFWILAGISFVFVMGVVLALVLVSLHGITRAIELLSIVDPVHPVRLAVHPTNPPPQGLHSSLTPDLVRVDFITACFNRTERRQRDHARLVPPLLRASLGVYHVPLQSDQRLPRNSPTLARDLIRVGT